MPKSPSNFTSTTKDGWRKREYADLTEQWSTLEGSRKEMYLELHEICGAGYRVVSRAMPYKDNKCPPIISGPHNTLEAGKAAYLVALATL